MNIHDEAEKSGMPRKRARRSLKKLADSHGVPDFALRLLEARFDHGHPKTPVRYRHD